ncbi:MAG: hypothetical protein HY901_27295 [Deltaproteobacteria bacterium]|nr:hypothetical protein [Deltaproteobacteria bacterium]
MLAQTEGLSAVELAERLELDDPVALRPWTARLLELDLIKKSGRTKAMRYFVPPELLRAAGLDGVTTLKRVQPHRLRALIVEDLERYPNSSISDIQRRVAPELSRPTFKRAVDALVEEKRVEPSGTHRWRTYRATAPIEQGGDRDR